MSHNKLTTKMQFDFFLSVVLTFGLDLCNTLNLFLLHWILFAVFLIITPKYMCVCVCVCYSFLST